MPDSAMGRLYRCNRTDTCRRAHSTQRDYVTPECPHCHHKMVQVPIEQDTAYLHWQKATTLYNSTGKRRRGPKRGGRQRKKD
jgi:hypothetical protein